MIGYELVPGRQAVIGGLRVTPQARVFKVRTPRFTWVWSRPVGIVVQRRWHAEHVSIVDVTRRAQALLWGCSVLFAAIGIVLSCRRRRR